VIEAQEDLADAQDARDSAARDLRLSVLNFLLNTGQMRVTANGQWLPPARLTALPDDEPDAIDTPDGGEVSAVIERPGRDDGSRLPG